MTEVNSVNGKTGVVVLTAADVEAIPASELVFLDSITPHGAVADCRTFSDAMIETGTPNKLHSTQAAFTLADEHKAVCVANAGPLNTGANKGAYGPLVTKISAVEAGVAILETAASTSVSGAKGAVGTDNAVPFQLAATAAMLNQTACLLPSGNYLTTESMYSEARTGGHGLTLVGAGSGVTNIYYASNTEPFIKQVGGGRHAGILVTKAAVVGAQEIEVENASTFKVGEYVLLRDPSQHIYGYEASVEEKPGKNNVPIADAGEILRIKEIKGNILVFFGAFDFEYKFSAEGSKCSRVQPLPELIHGVHIQGLSVINPMPVSMSGNPEAFRFENVEGIYMDDVHFVDLDAPAIQMTRCINFAYSNLLFDNLRDLEDEQGVYSIIGGRGTSHGVISHCLQRKGRHFATWSGGPASGTEPIGDISAAHILVADCNVTETNGACFDTHPGARRITYADCKAHNSHSAGFQVRGPDCTIVNPDISGCPQGILVYNNADRTRIFGGRITGAEEAIYMTNSDGLRVDDLLIEKPTKHAFTLDAEGEGYSEYIKSLHLDKIDVIGNPSEAAFQFVFWRNTFEVKRIKASEATTPVSGMSIVTAASAATLALPSNADEIEVTGTTTISNLSVADATQIGRLVTLVFAGGLTVASTGNIRLGRSFTSLAGATLTLVYDGVHWREVARAGDAVQEVTGPLAETGTLHKLVNALATEGLITNGTTATSASTWMEWAIRRFRPKTPAFFAATMLDDVMCASNTITLTGGTVYTALLPLLIGETVTGLGMLCQSPGENVTHFWLLLLSGESSPKVEGYTEDIKTSLKVGVVSANLTAPVTPTEGQSSHYIGFLAITTGTAPTLRCALANTGITGQANIRSGTAATGRTERPALGEAIGTNSAIEQLIWAGAY